MDNRYTEEPTKAAATQRGVKEQPQTQVRPQRSVDSLGPPRPVP